MVKIAAYVLIQSSQTYKTGLHIHLLMKGLGFISVLLYSVPVTLDLSAHP